MAHNSAALIDEDILARCKAAKIRLRRDKVVLRLVSGLRTALADVIPDGEAVMFTVTAPIRLPEKTAAVLDSLVHNGLPCGDTRSLVQGNLVQIRRLSGVAPRAPRVLCFVHDPGCDAERILSLAEAALRSQR